MTRLRTVHTAGVPAPELARIRDLLDQAFDGRFDDADWEHALGGLHVVVTDGDSVIAHAAVVQRQLAHRDGPIRTGYVEAVAVHVRRRGEGHGAAAMTEAERVIRAAYDLGALSASHGVEAFYRSRGWLSWQGPTYVLTPTGMTRTPEDDDSTFVLPVSDRHPVRVTEALACDWRTGDVW